MSVRISYIVPVYNGEKYLSQCFDSIYGQGIDENEFEVICVDDCSSDNSMSILQSYQEKHSNLVLLRHEINRKAGGARNTGMRNATGDYLWFVDSDDCISDNAAKTIINECYTNQLDVLCFNFFIKAGDSEAVDYGFKISSQLDDGISFLINQFGNCIVQNLGYPWRAVYKRQLIVDNTIGFLENCLYGEETTFMAEAVIASRKVKCIPDALYCYRQTEQSASSQLSQQMRGDLIFQSIIVAGNMVLDLQHQVKSQSNVLSNNIVSGLPWFVNRLFLRMVRTSSIERGRFYGELKKMGKKELLPILQYMDYKNKFIIEAPHVGKMVLGIVSFLYKVKKSVLG